jgi:hypothetical protein
VMVVFVVMVPAGRVAVVVVMGAAAAGGAHAGNLRRSSVGMENRPVPQV